jgi:hypothetical protein
MKHWDLIPGENVTLSGVGQKSLIARFLFRDTVHACFVVDGGLREFALRDDGALVDRLPEIEYLRTFRRCDRSIEVRRSAARFRRYLVILDAPRGTKRADHMEDRRAAAAGW